MNRQRRSPLRSLHVVCFAALAVAACQDTSGPDDGASLDTERALADYHAVGAFLDADALRSFVAAGPRVAAAAWPVAAAQEAGSVPLISEHSRGTTFVYDAARDRYVADPSLAGAPQDGVRFLLYALDPATGRPDPGRQTGHADLIDLGRSGDDVVSLRLTGVHEGETFLDYGIELDPRVRGGTIAVGGFLRDHNDRLEFEVEADGVRENGIERVVIDFAIRIPSRDFEARLGLIGMEEDDDERGELDFEARHGPHRIRVVGAGSDDEIDATFYANGKAFATATGEPDNPTIAGVDGRTLTVEEIALVVAIVKAAAGMGMLLDCVAAPAGGLVLLALLL